MVELGVLNAPMTAAGSAPVVPIVMTPVAVATNKSMPALKPTKGTAP
jgi:hypothetical protein